MGKLPPAITLDHNPQRTTHHQQLIDSLVSLEVVVTLILANFLLLLYSINLPLYPQHYTPAKWLLLLLFLLFFVSMLNSIIIIEIYKKNSVMQ